MPLTDNNLLTIENTLTSVQSTLDAQISRIADLLTQASQLNTLISSLNTRLADTKRVTMAGMTCYTGMQRWEANTTSNKEQIGVWIDSGGHTAQSNPGINTTPHGTFTWTPGDETKAARIDFKPAAGWDNIFIYERFPLPTSLPSVVIDKRTFSLSPTDRAAVNCIEWQQEFIWKGKVYNLGWQWNFGSKAIRYFDFTAQTWKSTGIPFTDLGAVPTEVVTEHLLDETNGKTTHLAISIGGIRFPVNITQSATPISAADKYTVSIFQLDSNSKGTPFGLNIHKAESRYL